MSESVVVIGGGTMGAGIAALIASRGLPVVVVEPNVGARERLLELHPELSVLDALPGKIDATLVIEAIVERLDIKRSVFSELMAATAPTTIVASNTSSLSIADISSGLADPSRIVGLHFFNPPHAMKLIEVVRATHTSDETVARALAFVERLGKEAIVCADTPGFVVNRVARPYYLQAMLAYEAGVASFAQIDAIARGVGFRMGPFELMDLIGIDINLATTQSVFERTRAARLAPVDLQQQMVDAQTLGRKSGRGFYLYSEGAPERLDLSDTGSGLPADTRIAILGFDIVAEELAQAFEEKGFAPQSILNDDLIEDIDPETEIVLDCGDGASDRVEALVMLESALPEHCTLLVDAYTTDVTALRERLRAPHRLVGFGLLSGLERQDVVEIVDADDVDENALMHAREAFATLGRHTVLVEDRPGLYLGRTVASIINEAVCVVAEEVASVADVDRAMLLGTNYPYGPIAWGRQIGGARIARILERLAHAYGSQFAPHRALWVLDVDPDGEAHSEMTLGEPVL